MAPGDVIVGLPSSGIHSNGYTLVRAVLDRSGLSLDSPAPFEAIHPGREIRRFPGCDGEVSIGEVLLNPTRIYVDPIVDLINLCRSGEGPCDIGDIKAIAHITGGGLSNLLRLHESLGWHISDPLPVSPEFDWIAEVGEVQIKEMHRTFNMGMGMALAVSGPVGEVVSSWVAERLPGTRIVGEIRDQGHKVTHVDSRVSFDHY